MGRLTSSGDTIIWKCLKALLACKTGLRPEENSRSEAGEGMKV